jgi:hypothetical protein
VSTKRPATEQEESRQKESKSTLKLLSGYTIKVSRYGSVDALCVILQMLLVLQHHLTDSALEPISFFDVGQMPPLEVLCQVAWTG